MTADLCWFPVPADKLPENNARRMLWIAERPIIVFQIDGRFYGIEDGCPHQGASMFTGKLEPPWLQCPAHGLKFDITTGQLSGGGACSLRSLVTRFEAGQLYLAFKAE